MKALRAVVSGSRVRYMQDGYDLDLTYITPRLIAMGYPAAGVEKTYRNNISEVAEFLNSHHPESYRVFNLSERKYDYSKFDSRVTECGFPDHHPPPLQILLDIMNDMLEWTARSSKHVVVVHCLAGKGRTGVVCSCYLLLVGFYGSIYKLRKEKEIREIANRAIRDFWNARGQGVRFPSQALYIYYFIKVLRRLGSTAPTRIPPLLPAKRLVLKRVVLHGIPDFDAPPRGGIIPFLQVLPAPSQHEKHNLLYNSSWQQPKFETYAPDPDGCIVFDTNCVIQGDILIRAFHANSSAILGKHFSQIFHFTFNTDFLRKDSLLLRMHRDEIDDVGASARFPPKFFVDCETQPLDDDSDNCDNALLSSNDSNSASVHAAAAAANVSMPSKQLAKLASSPALVQSAPPPPIMGWLYKQGGFVKNWKKRWFVARDGKIMYFHSPSDPTPLGTVDLRRVAVDVCAPHELNARNQCLYYFKIVPPQRDQRTYYFGADSESEMVRWIRALGTQSCYGIEPTSNSVNTRSASVATANKNRNSFQRGSSARFSDSRVAYSQQQQQHYQPDALPVSVLRITSPPAFGQLAAATQQFAVTSGRSSRGHNATELTYNMQRPSSSGSTRDSLVYQEPQQQQQRQSSVRGSSASLTETETETDDVDTDVCATTGRPQYVASKPIAFAPQLSERERQTMLQEVESFSAAHYVYSADELAEIAQLQTHLRTTLTRDQQATLSARVRTLVAQQRLADAEELLVDAVLQFFPSLIDAMDYDPLAFTHMIADTTPTEPSYGNGTSYGNDNGRGSSIYGARSSDGGVYF